MEALYKRKGKVGNKEKRKELSRLASKAKREEILDSKRRMPLGELNVADPKRKSAIDTKKAKAEERLQQLKEWQKARQEAKMKADAAKSKKPAFSLGKSSSVNFAPQVNFKRKSVPQNNNEGNEVPSSGQPLPSKPAAARGVAKHTAPKVKKATPIKRSRPTRGSTQQDVQQPKRSKPVSKTRATTKSQSIAKTRSAPSTERPKSAPQPVKGSAQKKSKSSATSVTTMSTIPPRKTRNLRNKEVTQQSPLKEQQEPSSPPCRTVDKPATKTAATPPPQPLVIEVPPTTPNKKSYRPVCPSPLLRSRSASCRAQSEPIEPTSVIFVDEPAWIPGASAPENPASNKFGDFMDSFSPFKFGGGESDFQFNFNKDLPEGPAAGNSPETKSASDSETSSTSGSGSKKRRGRRRSRFVNESEENIVPCVLAANEEKITTNSDEVTERVDILRFRKLHSDVCEKLVSLCEIWEPKKTSLEESDGDFEQVLGQIRGATGGAQLLMKEKLKQYIGLVDTAEAQSGLRKTTAEDLQGFWDMVYYQVEVLFKMFADLDELERNNWILSQPSPKKTKLQRKRNIASRKPKKAAVVSEAAKAKMMERREELKRLKMKARQQLQEKEMETDSNRVEEAKEEESMMRSEEAESAVEGVREVRESKTIEVPSTEQIAHEEDTETHEEDTETHELRLQKRELEDAIPPSPLRRSTRIKNRSVFSPMCSPVLPARRSRNTPKKGLQEDAPIGVLISF